MKLINLIFKDKNGKWAIWQWPNLTLILWLLMRLVSGLTHTGATRNVGDVLAFGLSFAWAWMEIMSGSSYFRRVLGLIILVFIIKAQV